jgi:hypothetical protein
MLGYRAKDSVLSVSAVGAVLVCACSLDWDALDPRLGETSGTAGVEPAAGGGSGVSGSTPIAGAAGMPVAGGTGATTGSAVAAGAGGVGAAAGSPAAAGQAGDGTVPTGGVAGAAAAGGQAGAGTVPTGGVAGAAAAGGQAGDGTVPTGGVAGAAAAGGQAGDGTVPTGGVAGAAAAGGQAGDGGAAGANDAAPACVVIDYVAGTGTLSEHQVKFELDTQTLIETGAMQPDCADLRVRFGAGGGTELPLWIAEHSCNSPATEVWVRVPQIPGGGTVVVELWWGDPTAPSVADGELVFEFFDGFEGAALDSARWQVHGSGSVTVAEGVLASVGDVMLQTQANVMASGTRVLGVRIKAESVAHTDVELGAGDVSGLAGSGTWAFDRQWDGVTFLSYDDTLYVVDGPPGSSCNSPTIDPRVMRVGPAWVDTPTTAPATFLTAEFGYQTASTGTQAWLETSRALRLEGTSADACELPSQLPALIGPDHESDSHTPTQELDYVYVRRHAAVQPTASLPECSAVSP